MDAILCFETGMFAKMMELARSSKKMVAWHGLVRRDEEDQRKFVIYDILTYPYHSTTSTVSTNNRKYVQWLANLPDEQFIHMRLLGHSCVNDGVAPSIVDEVSYSKISSQLTGDTFYVFLSINNRGDKWARIYDAKNNCRYERSDIIWEMSLEESVYPYPYPQKLLC
jgi:hypothetical protein